MATEQKFIGFNKPYFTGQETNYILEAVAKRKISGNGYFTLKCQEFFEKKYGFRKCLLTTSCTDALEMAAILLDVQPGDEIIIPSYTFVSTANAFVLRGAKIIFIDSSAQHPNMDAEAIEKLITPKTKAIVPVHYAGMACDMEKIMTVASKHNLFVVEDAAQSVDSYFKDKPLGGIGHLAAFSFHETKNIISGEGGMLVINDQRFEKRAEIIWEKGTNRAAFFKGEVDKYGWVDIGSSFLPSDIIAAFLFAQLENLADIQEKRIHLWERYNNGLKNLEKNNKAKLPTIPCYATNNAHMFYLDCLHETTKDRLMMHLKEKGINAVFHYLSLHKSPFYANKHDDRELPWSNHYSTCLVRLPFYYELSAEDQDYIIQTINDFYNS